DRSSCRSRRPAPAGPFILQTRRGRWSVAGAPLRGRAAVLLRAFGRHDPFGSSGKRADHAPERRLRPHPFGLRLHHVEHRTGAGSGSVQHPDRGPPQRLSLRRPGRRSGGSNARRLLRLRLDRCGAAGHPPSRADPRPRRGPAGDSPSACRSGTAQRQTRPPPDPQPADGGAVHRDPALRRIPLPLRPAAGAWRRSPRCGDQAHPRTADRPLDRRRPRPGSGDVALGFLRPLPARRRDDSDGISAALADGAGEGPPPPPRCVGCRDRPPCRLRLGQHLQRRLRPACRPSAELLRAPAAGEL
ncbi:MAG: Transcriptional regulator, AraC family, partial [uncultured Sphingomonadaceae bacterium]